MCSFLQDFQPKSRVSRLPIIRLRAPCISHASVWFPNNNLCWVRITKLIITPCSQTDGICNDAVWSRYDCRTGMRAIGIQTAVCCAISVIAPLLCNCPAFPFYWIFRCVFFCKQNFSAIGRGQISASSMNVGDDVTWHHLSLSVIL